MHNAPACLGGINQCSMSPPPRTMPRLADWASLMLPSARREGTNRTAYVSCASVCPLGTLDVSVTLSSPRWCRSISSSHSAVPSATYSAVDLLAGSFLIGIDSSRIVHGAVLHIGAGFNLCVHLYCADVRLQNGLLASARCGFTFWFGGIVLRQPIPPRASLSVGLRAQ
jgi:hypothetical protein